jgi:hypothetical protein
MYLGPSHIYLCKKTTKNLSLLSIVAFSAICQVCALMVSEKFHVIKLWRLAKKHFREHLHGSENGTGIRGDIRLRKSPTFNFTVF